MSTLKSNSIQPTTTGNNLIFRTGAGDVERMRIDTSGNVGIGTNSPDSRLHVVGSQIKFDTGTTAGLRLYEDAGTASFLRFRPLNASQRGFVFSNDGAAPHLTVSWDAANSATTRVGIGTASPAAALDVNGTLRVGNFGGNTNVMAKLNNDVSDSNGNIGCAVPLMALVGVMTTTPLPSGTWFVYLNARENAGSTDEEIAAVMAKVWTVPSGNWLRFKPINSAPTSTEVRISYSLDNATTSETAGTWTAITAPNGSYYGSPTPSTIFGTGAAATHAGVVHYTHTTGIEFLDGFAIRIA